MLPKLQVALDLTDLDEAINFVKDNKNIENLDIVEVGTVLLASAGADAIREIKKYAKDKEIVADFKIADAAKTLITMFFNAGADYTTVIASASPVSMEIASKIAKEKNKTVQIELYGDWDEEKARSWIQTGLNHIIYHHSRDANEDWDDSDLEKIKLLLSLGYTVSVTGGLTPEIIPLFKGLKIHSFLVGRTIYQSKEPHVVVHQFKEMITKVFEE